MVQLSFQLYSVREFDLDTVLAQLSAEGIQEVEGYGPLLEDPIATKAKLDSYGLRMTTGHFSIEMIEDDPERAIHIAKTLGLEAVIVPFIAPEDRPKDYAGWAAFGSRLAKAGKPIVDAGLDFAWHNHEFEFAADAGGKLPLDAILDSGDHIKLELDLGWVAFCGLDPVETIEKYADRIIAVHAKDRAVKGKNLDQEGWAALGHGTLDWKTIGNKLNALGIPRAVLEHDRPTDAAKFIEQSLPIFKSL